MKRLGIYIDISNIELGMADYNCEGMALDYSELIREISEGYELIILKGYGGDSVEGTHEARIQRILAGAGVDLRLFHMQSEHTVTGHSVRKQKEVDTAVSVDPAMDLALGIVDAAVILSADRDMNPALQRCWDAGFDIRVIGLKECFSDDYLATLKDYAFIEDFEAFDVSGEKVGDKALNIASFNVMNGGEIDV